MTHHHKHNETLDELKEELDEVREQARETADAAQEAEAAQVEQSDKIAAMQAEIDKMKDLYLRSQAEMENLRRRTRQELEKRSKFAVSSFAQDLLPVNDNLSSAMASIPDSERDGQSDLVKNLLIGLELTNKGLNAIRPIESGGCVFDPTLHKVVHEVEDPTKPAGTIVQEWQKGYTIGGDRVLREAMVVVTRGGPRAGDDKAEHVDTTV